MLLSTTDEGYDIWTDEIWVNYTTAVKGAKGDQVTVYGVVKGQKSYDTQISGSNTVPEIQARYMVE